MTTTETSQQDFAAWFQETFGAPFPVPLAAPLTGVNDRVWVSDGLVGSVDAPPMMPEFPEQDGDYTIAGMWGHGVNSSAFYFVERRGPHQRFFRLMCGGGYGDFKAEVQEVLGFLDGYRRWQEEHEAQLQASTLIHNMGMNKAELSRGGEPVELIEPDSGDAWWQRLAAA